MRFEAEILTKNVVKRSHIPFTILEHLKTNGIDFLQDDKKPKDYCYAIKSIRKDRIINAVFSFYDKKKGLDILRALLTESDILQIINFTTLKEKQTTGTFKTLSPIVLYDTDKRAYVSDNNIEDFSRLAKINITKLLSIIAGIDIKDSDLHIELVALERILKTRVYVPKAKDTITLYGLKGIIDIQAENYILNIIAKTGIGRRRSLGYGLIEPL
ncbi:MAG: CRISPR-associated endoribonuclease Cas6 [Candidatus Micrarchaeaceae archaeon]